MIVTFYILPNQVGFCKEGFDARGPAPDDCQSSCKTNGTVPCQLAKRLPANAKSSPRCAVSIQLQMLINHRASQASEFGISGMEHIHGIGEWPILGLPFPKADMGDFLTLTAPRS
jgi:hypothetical protein